jgi:pilus assembly protein CpaD
VIERTPSISHIVRVGGALRLRVAFVAAGALLAACAQTIDPWDAPLPPDRHPITVRETRSVMEVRVDPENFGLTYQDKDALAAFAQEYLDTGRELGPIIVAQPVGTAHDDLVVKREAAVRDALYDRGIAYRMIQGTSYDASSQADAPLVVMFDRYVAEGPKCHDAWDDLAKPRAGGPSHNFGCATQANIAAAVTNPADFIGPRSMTPPSADRRSGVLADYRSGESTITTHSDSESATVTN